ncbi:hypothetical protein J7K50_02565 [bacterium]|nr:hypothetical protein [bacterium]
MRRGIKGTQYLFWLHFAKFVLGRERLNPEKVAKCIYGKPPFSRYRRLPDFVTEMASHGQKDGQDLINYALEQGVSQEKSTRIGESYEKVMNDHVCRAWKSSGINEEYNTGVFHVTISFDAVWSIDAEWSYMKYLFASTEGYAPDRELSAVLLATATLTIPPGIHKGQLSLFTANEDVPPPGEIDYWVLKFQGIDSGIHRLKANEVEELRAPIEDVARKLDAIIPKIPEALKNIKY